MLTFMYIYKKVHFFLHFVLYADIYSCLKNKYFITLNAFKLQNVHLQMSILLCHGHPVQHRLTCNSSNNEACLGASWSLTQSI